MPKNLKQYLDDQISEIPRLMIINTLKQKIEDAGINRDADKIAEALMDHLSSESTEPFVWNDGLEDDRSLKLDFTEEDVAKIDKKINDFLNNDLPELLRTVIFDTAKAQLKQAKKEWPEYYIWERGQVQIFRDNLELRWGKGLTLLRLFQAEVRQIGQNFADKLQRSKAKRNIPKREAILMLHMRGCQAMSEIITLIESGYADGAMARWRTLYELRVVAEMIEKFGDDIAFRYFDHQHVTRRREMDNDLRHFTPEELENTDHQTKQIIDDNFGAVIQEYGPSFATPYGWAASSVGKKKPTFRDLEASVGLPELPTNFKMASYKVHAGIAGLKSALGTLDPDAPPIAGASNTGLDAPAINTAYTVVQFTGLLFGRLTKIEDQIHANALSELRDEIHSEFSKAARKLERDELKVRRLALKDTN